MSITKETTGPIFLPITEPIVGAEAGPGAGVDNLLLETGDHLLLESGVSDVLILE